MSEPHVTLPSITLSADDFERLARLADAAADTMPRTAAFLAREIDRAAVVADDSLPAELVRMGSTVEFRDDANGQARTVKLVYPDEADLDAGRISVLTPIGAALIGLSVGQSIEWHMPNGGSRSLTVLGVTAS